MRIGILSQYYPPEIGAPQARLSELAQRFAARGHDVTVLTAKPNYPRGRIYPGYPGLWGREESAGVHIVRTAIYPCQSVGVRRLASYGSFVLSSSLIGSVALARLDALITESPPLFLGLSGYWLSRLKRARWIFNVSDLWPESAVRLGIARDGRALRLAYALEAFCYRNAWLVTGQSREILRDIERRFPQVATWHLSNGVTPEIFSPAARSAEARARLGGGDCIALYAGLHGVAQGLGQVIDAAALLQDVPGLRLLLVGDGPEKARLIQRSREQRLANVSFLDAVSREEMPAVLASADLAVVPLLKHLPGAVPSKIYEAMGVGVPMVLAGDGEAAEIITSTGSGLVVPPGRPDCLAAAIRELAGNEARRRQFGAAGIRAASTAFNRRFIVERFLQHLERNIVADAGLQYGRCPAELHEDDAPQS